MSAGDVPRIRAMVAARPELAHKSGALHVAVIARAREFVRVLMQHGANARVDVYPHRHATSSAPAAMRSRTSWRRHSRSSPWRPVGLDDME